MYFPNLTLCHAWIYNKTSWIWIFKNTNLDIHFSLVFLCHLPFSVLNSKPSPSPLILPGRTRTCCPRWTAGTWCWTRRGARAATTPRSATSTTTTSLSGWPTWARMSSDSSRRSGEECSGCQSPTKKTTTLNWRARRRMDGHVPCAGYDNPRLGHSVHHSQRTTLCDAPTSWKWLCSIHYNALSEGFCVMAP